MKKADAFSHFIIIFNPNSTGDAPDIARQVKTSLLRKVAAQQIIVSPTEYAGHAIELARLAARRYPHPLIISISGDGGYNEVINGVLRAGDLSSGHLPTVTVIGAGNANDHYRVVHKRRSIGQMLQRSRRQIDLLKVTKSSRDTPEEVVYAHSYVGVGITPLIAEELNRHKLNPLKELRILVKALTVIRPTRIRYEGKVKRIDSLVFANISQMAKVLTLTDSNSLHDGQFEVVEISHTNVLGLLAALLKAATVGLKKQPKRESYTFTMEEAHSLQVDGELLKCRKGDTLTVGVARDAIYTL